MKKKILILAGGFSREREISLKTAKGVFKEIKKIETTLGRGNKVRNSPRTCDIDIIDFNGKNMSINFGSQNIIVPHPRMKNRNFVLFPLFEIEKNWQHPANNRNIIDLMYNLSSKSLTTIKQI